MRPRLRRDESAAAYFFAGVSGRWLTYHPVDRMLLWPSHSLSSYGDIGSFAFASCVAIVERARWTVNRPLRS